jgi:putative transposase
MIASHKITLDPTNVQATYFAKASGVARFAYNWALIEWQKQYQARKEDKSLKAPSQLALRRQLNAVKYEQFPWMEEVTKCAPQSAIINLGKAFSNYFADLEKPKNQRHFKYPRLKKKGRAKDSFVIDPVKIDGKNVLIPKLGWVRMEEELRFDGHVVSAVVSRTADRWFIALTVRDAKLKKQRRMTENQGSVGVDLGVNRLAVLSNGEVVPGPKPHKRMMARLKRLSRSLSRKKRGSANRKKAAMKLAKLHARIANIRLDAVHKLTHKLATKFAVIGIEDLNVSGMLANRKLSRAISDMMLYEFRRQLEYKAQWHGSKVVVADRWFASSKTCSHCGHKIETLPLSVRTWTCIACGTEHDRDGNASKNLEKYAVSSIASACGAVGSGPGLTTTTKPTAMKQDENSIVRYA